MMYFLNIFLWLSVCWVAGQSLIQMLFFRQEKLYFLEKGILSFPLGMGLMSVIMSVLSLCGIPFSKLNLILSVLTFFVCSLFFFRKGEGSSRIIQADQKKESLGRFEKIIFFAILVSISYVVFLAFLQPLQSFDALTNYAVKSKLFYLMEAIPIDYVQKYANYLFHIEYPLLLPLVESSFYIFVGFLDDLGVKIIFPIFYISMIGTFYFVAVRFVRQRTAILFTFLLSTVPQLIEHGTIGYADLLLTFYCCTSVFYLALWMKGGNKGFLCLSVILSFFALMTKTNALMFILVNMVVVFCFLLIDKKKSMIRSGVVYSLMLFFVLVGYVFFVKYFGVNIHSDFEGSSELNIILTVINHLRYFPAILNEYQTQFFGLNKWNIIWVISILLSVFNFKQLFSGQLKYLTFIIILIFCGYTNVYLLTNLNIGWHLSTTGSRFFLHFLPIVVLIESILFDQYFK